MRSIFYLILACLVLRLFFPDVGDKLEQALLAFLDLADKAITAAAASATSQGAL